MLTMEGDQRLCTGVLQLPMKLPLQNHKKDDAFLLQDVNKYKMF